MVGVCVWWGGACWGWGGVREMTVSKSYQEGTVSGMNERVNESVPGTVLGTGLTEMDERKSKTRDTGVTQYLPVPSIYLSAR